LIDSVWGESIASLRRDPACIDSSPLEFLSNDPDQGAGLADGCRGLDRCDGFDVVGITTVSGERRQATEVWHAGRDPPVCWEPIPKVVEIVGPRWIDASKDECRLESLLNGLLAVEGDDPRPDASAGPGARSIKVADREREPAECVCLALSAHTR